MGAGSVRLGANDSPLRGCLESSLQGGEEHSGIYCILIGIFLG